MALPQCMVISLHVFDIFIMHAAIKSVVIPNDVVVVSQVKLLRVFSGVVNHSDSSHEIHDLLPGGVVQVIPALMSSVPMNPLQPQLTVGSRLICHALRICNGLPFTKVSFSGRSLGVEDTMVMGHLLQGCNLRPFGHQFRSLTNPTAMPPFNALLKIMHAARAS